MLSRGQTRVNIKVVFNLVAEGDYFVGKGEFFGVSPRVIEVALHIDVEDFGDTLDVGEGEAKFFTVGVGKGYGSYESAKNQCDEAYWINHSKGWWRLSIYNGDV